MLSSDVLVAGLSKMTAQQLLHRWIVGREVDSKVERPLNVCAVAVCAGTNAGFTLPWKNAIKASQLLMATEAEQVDIVLTMCGALGLDSQGMYHIPLKEKHVLCITKEDQRLQSILMVWAFKDARDHHGTVATSQALRPYCV